MTTATIRRQGRGRWVLIEWKQEEQKPHLWQSFESLEEAIAAYPNYNWRFPPGEGFGPRDLAITTLPD